MNGILFFHRFGKTKFMKKVVFFFVSVILINVFYSCSKDDDNSSNSLVGKWEMSLQGDYDGSEETVVNYVHNCNTSKDYISFQADGTCNLVTYSASCEEDNINANWSLSNNTITINFSSGVPMVLEIQEQTSSTLKLKYPEYRPGQYFFVILTKK